MCGRFVLTLPGEALAALFEAVPANDLPEVPDYNICPTARVHVVLHEAGSRRLAAMRWGFVPHWYKDPGDRPLLINARAETLAEKPAFRSACRERRCLIPASGFYEWTKSEDDRRLPWYIHAADDAPLALAGIWQDWRPRSGGDAIRTCAIVTTAANAEMSALHHRMPVTLAAPDWPLWLGEAGRGAAELMGGAPDGTFEARRVDPRVNSNRAKGPTLIEPLPADRV